MGDQSFDNFDNFWLNLTREVKKWSKVGKGRYLWRPPVATRLVTEWPDLVHMKGQWSSPFTPSLVHIGPQGSEPEPSENGKFDTKTAFSLGPLRP